ncbi:MAG: peptidyl-tRNA hydrolase Pth2 [Candidatus Undinarchaeales archaeon]
MEFKYKQAIVVRRDLNLSPGKLAVQVAHASEKAASHTDTKILNAWRKEGAKKAVLKAKSKEELFKLHEKARNSRLPTALIKDAGLTEIEPGTVTALGLGPALASEIDQITGNLPLY